MQGNFLGARKGSVAGAVGVRGLDGMSGRYNGVLTGGTIIKMSGFLTLFLHLRVSAPTGPP